jgi:hypothetical protein
MSQMLPKAIMSKKKVHVNQKLRKSDVGRIIIAMLYQFANNGKLSGRAEGNVYMRNGRIRGMTVPSLVNNPATAAARSLLAFQSNSWNGLSDDNRATWNNAVGFTKTDRFGRTVDLKGKNLYVSLNANIVNGGGTPIFDAPSSGAVYGPPTLTITGSAGGGTLSLAWTGGAIPPDTAWLVFATGLKSPGTSRPGKSDFRLIQVLPAADVTPTSIATAYLAKFGTLVAGKKIFVRVDPVLITTGQKGPGLITDNEIGV